jgi:hypothetical protein
MGQRRGTAGAAWVFAGGPAGVGAELDAGDEAACQRGELA